jgi:hypothetical protein
MAARIGGWDKVWSRKLPWAGHRQGGSPITKSREVYIDVWTAKDYECDIKSG